MRNPMQARALPPFLRWGVGVGVLGLMLAGSPSALAQARDGGAERPSARELAAPDYAAPTSPPPLEAVPLPPGEPPLSRREQLFVRRFELSGNTAFTTAELAAVTAPYENRTLTAEELQEVRRLVTLYYVERGYFNSGAVLPDQQVVDGVVRLQIIEGALSEIEVTGATRLRPSYFQDRLRPEPDAPLNLLDLQDRLQILQQNPLIDQFQAELSPGVQPGESRLRLGVWEARPYELGLTVANNNPPSVGATRATLYGLHRNLTGVGDSLSLYYGRSLENSDADQWGAAYARPVNARDTTVQLWANHNETSVIEDRFATLDITSKLQTYGLGLTHPLHRTPQQTLSLGANLEWRRSESFLLDIPFSFAPGEIDGKATLTVARFVQEWLDRQPDQVIAARSTFSLGLDAAGATVGGFGPDGRFVAWLGQFQWARRFGERGHQAIFRSILQVSDDPLLSMEKCALGGLETVRGYPENTLVRDRCFVASLEFRTPIHELPLPGISGPGEGAIHLAAFADYGYAKNKGAFDLKPHTLASAGFGARWEPGATIRTALYWGYPFRDVDVGEEAWTGSRVNFFVQVAY